MRSSTFHIKTGSNKMPLAFQTNLLLQSAGNSHSVTGSGFTGSDNPNFPARSEGDIPNLEVAKFHAQLFFRENVMGQSRL
jgi:hypothetical protein